MSTDNHSKASEDDHKKFGEIFTFYGERSSMNGLIFLMDSKNRKVKVIWALIILAGTAAMIYHLYSLVSKFLMYSTHTEINIGFSSLEFPAVTICNVNIMRLSKEDEASSIVKEYVQNLTKMNPKKKASETNNGTNADATNTQDDENDTDFLDTIDDDYDSDNDVAEDEYYDQNDPDSWEAVANRSQIVTIAENFKNLYSSMNVSQQSSVGHQFQDMIRQCSFATRICNKNVTQITTAEYGNCYTLQDKRLISKYSGPSGGLELILYLETDEYLPYVTSGKGAQIVIHAQNTVPLPGDEGITIPAGQQVMIGLKEIKITRLGEPYTPCVDADEYNKLYNVTYTRNLCQKICYLKRIADECKCQDTHFNHINKLLKLTGNNSCSNSTEVNCVAGIKNKFQADDASCKCFSPCREKVYDLQSGYRKWPNQDMADVLVIDVCRNEPEMCLKMRNKTATEIQENFIKLNIFYRDLNYEELLEQKNYELIQLLSDLGGSIGLWIGLSIISLFEIVHLILDLSHYAVCKTRQ